MTRQLRHKYKAKPCELDGIKFASKLEARYYAQQKLRIAAGEIIFSLRQVAFDLPGNTRYFCDFLEFHADGSVHVVDTKGVETAAFKRAKKQVEAIYPVEIEVVKKA